MATLGNKDLVTGSVSAAFSDAASLRFGSGGHDGARLARHWAFVTKK
jgi:hypothetical protein